MTRPSTMTPEELSERYPNIAKNLEILVEECSEVSQIKSKIFRFGLTLPNKDELESELGDLLAMMRILDANGVVDLKNIHKASCNKLDQLEQWYDVESDFVGDVCCHQVQL